jgi:hypothetical protein
MNQVTYSHTRTKVHVSDDTQIEPEHEKQHKQHADHATLAWRPFCVNSGSFSGSSVRIPEAAKISIIILISPNCTSSGLVKPVMYPSAGLYSFPISNIFSKPVQSVCHVICTKTKHHVFAPKQNITFAPKQNIMQGKA